MSYNLICRNFVVVVFYYFIISNSSPENSLETRTTHLVTKEIIWSCFIKCQFLYMFSSNYQKLFQKVFVYITNFGLSKKKFSSKILRSVSMVNYHRKYWYWLMFDFLILQFKSIRKSSSWHSYLQKSEGKKKTNQSFF